MSYSETIRFKVFNRLRELQDYDTLRLLSAYNYSEEELKIILNSIPIVKPIKFTTTDPNKNQLDLNL